MILTIPECPRSARRAAALLALLLLAATGIAGAEPISVGQTLTGLRFEWKRGYGSRSAGAYGQYEVELASGRSYEIFTSDATGGNTSDPYLYLLTAAGAIAAEDDDSGGGLNSKLVFSPASSGTYLIRLRAYGYKRYGYCSLTVREEAAPPPAAEAAIRPGDVLYGQVFEWRREYSGRRDGTYGQYRIDMRAQEEYTFETSDSAGGDNDTYLYLLESSFSVVRYDDDSGEGYHSRLRFQPATDGVYYLRLRAYRRGASGTCTLRVTASTSTPGDPLYPDLIVWTDRLRDAHVSREGGRKLLRFSNGVPNAGAGPLEVYGVVDGTGQTQAYQVVYNDNGSRTTHSVGTFSFAGHEDHNHWHYDDFAQYELRDPSGNLVRAGEKISFCLMDVSRYDGSLPGSPSSGVYSCSRQGISVGWADIYGADLEGQHIDITGVADGDYTLVSIVDPTGRLHESNRANNLARIGIRISGDGVAILP